MNCPLPPSACSIPLECDDPVRDVAAAEPDLEVEAVRRRRSDDAEQLGVT
jgi:hypothetical protein